MGSDEDSVLNAITTRVATAFVWASEGNVYLICGESHSDDASQLSRKMMLMMAAIVMHHRAQEYARYSLACQLRIRKCILSRERNRGLSL